LFSVLNNDEDKSHIVSRKGKEISKGTRKTEQILGQKFEGDQYMHAWIADVVSSSSLRSAWAVAGDVAFGPTSIAGALLRLGAVPADVTNAGAVVAL